MSKLDFHVFIPLSLLFTRNFGCEYNCYYFNILDACIKIKLHSLVLTGDVLSCLWRWCISQLEARSIIRTLVIVYIIQKNYSTVRNENKPLVYSN